VFLLTVDCRVNGFVRCTEVIGQRFDLEAATFLRSHAHDVFRFLNAHYPPTTADSPDQERIIDDLMAGERTFDVSQKYGLSPGRISQLRRRLHDDWEVFCAAPDNETVAV
jgi:hypothetical protein